jgi:hypothetical protein
VDAFLKLLTKIISSPVYESVFARNRLKTAQNSANKYNLKTKRRLFHVGITIDGGVIKDHDNISESRWQGQSPTDGLLDQLGVGVTSQWTALVKHANYIAKLVTGIEPRINSGPPGNVRNTHFSCKQPIEFPRRRKARRNRLKMITHLPLTH